MENIHTISFIERIDSLLVQRNEKRLILTESIGITHSALSDWKKRGTIPSGDICLKIAKYFNVSVEWLITGQNTTLISEYDNFTQEEKTVINNYRKLDDKQKNAVYTMIENLLPEEKKRQDFIS